MADKKSQSKIGTVKTDSSPASERRSKLRLDPCAKPQSAEAARPDAADEACDDGVK